MPSTGEEKLYKDLIDALKANTEALSGFANIMNRANEMGYVGDEGVVPMFSEEIRRSREELKRIKEEFSTLTIDFNMAKAKEKFEEVRDEYEELSWYVENGMELSDDALNRWVALDDIHKDLVEQEKEYEKATNKSIDDLEDVETIEESINEKMIEGLIKRNEENKLLGKINKELAYRNKKEEEGVSIQEMMTHYLDNHVMNVSKFNSGIHQLNQGFGNLMGSVKGIIEPWGKLNQAAADYAKSIGMSHDRFRELQKTINKTAHDRQLAAKYNISDVEALKAQQNFSLNIGRQIGFNANQLEDTSALQSIIGENDVTNYITQLESFGLSQSEVASRVGEMFKDSEKSSVSFNKYSKTFLDNIKLAQTYTFSKGIDGLSKMARRSAEIKMNISEVAKFADKISTLEGATQTAAGLSVLGGNFALGANPLTMLYNGLNNMEGVQGQMENMLKGLVYYDKEKGTLDMNSYDRMRLRQASQIMGVDYNNMVETAFSMGRENFVSEAVRGRGIGRDSREYQALLNRSFIRNGEAYVNVDNKEVAVKDLSKEQIGRVVQTDFKEEEGIRKIAETLLGFQDKIDAIQKAKENELTYWVEVSGIGDTTDKILDFVKENARWLALLQGTSSAILAAVSLMGMGGGMFNMASAFGRRGPVVGATPKGVSGTNMGTRLSPSPGRLIPSTPNAVGGSAATAGTGVTRSAMGVGARLGGAAMGGLVGYGLGSFVGGYAEHGITKGADKELYSKDKDTRENAILKKSVGSSVNNALTWGLSGAGAGMAFGPLGAIIGLAGGALAGGLYGYFNAKSEAEKEMLLGLIRSNDGISLEGDYSSAELRTMLGGYKAIKNNDALKNKITRLEGISGDGLKAFKKVDGYKNGGVIRGVGSGTSDSNLAWVSNNEYIMPADKTLKPNNRKILDSMRSGDDLIPSYKDGGVNITPTGNRLNIMKVNDYGRNVGVNTPSVGTTKVELAPLTINGSIRLEMNGQSRNVSASDIFDNPYNLRQLTDIIAKNLNRQYNFGFDKNEFYKKY